MIAIAMEIVRSEYLLVEVDDAEQRGKYILYQHAEFFYYAINPLCCYYTINLVTKLQQSLDQPQS